MFRIFLAIFAVIHLSESSVPGSSQQRIVQPDLKDYRVSSANSDKLKFGYELSENQHFHHTTQEEDGVRLGCYGHVLEGKKYSTQYVADAKGYRPVYTSDLITVYPKSGGERKASFIKEFSEDEIMSQNIRFFFPDGCRKDYQPTQPRADESRIRENVVLPPPTRFPQRTSSTTRATTTTPASTQIENDSCAQRVPDCVCTCSY